MHLPENYYHCFMGNGLDAVLIGYTGSMVADKVGVDRCAWYKADRYYPEQKLVKVAGRFPMEKTLEHAEGSGWFELAPLGRTWYEGSFQGTRLELVSSSQRFVPQEGVLYTELDFGPVQARAVTFLHFRESLLVERYEFSAEVELGGWMAPGVWLEEGWDTDPFLSVSPAEGAARIQYDLGETQGTLFLSQEPAKADILSQGSQRGLTGRGRSFTRYFSILDNRQGEDAAQAFARSYAPGYAALLEEQKAFWQAYAAHSSLTIPDPQFQYFYEASQYHFKAAQNRLSGGLPVNNLRRTWSSHVFWDSYYIQRALLESNHLAESSEACRFFQRTLDAARRHARDEFGCGGLKWDWEITHDGRKAYGTLLHMKYQAHNNASYANEIWQHYLFTLDRSFLAEYLPILEGLAQFFSECIVEQTGRGWEIRPLVGVSENPVQVKNEGISLAGTIVILEHYAAAARLLGKESDFTRKCSQVALGLRKTLDLLFNGETFVYAEGATGINTSSTGPIYPMQVIPFRDQRAIQTAQAVLASRLERASQDGHTYAFPWAWGVLATIFARQGDGLAAWQAIQRTRSSLCNFGGMTEVFQDGAWNMQYFLTAQGAVVTALHNLMIQDDGERVLLFAALPPEWQECSFERLLAAGLEVSAAYRHGRVKGRARNITTQSLARQLCWGEQTSLLDLQPGEDRAFEFAPGHPEDIK